MKKMTSFNIFYWVLMFCSFIVWFGGLCVVVGFILDCEWMQNWIGHQAMAIEAGIMFIFVGLALCMLTSKIRA